MSGNENARETGDDFNEMQNALRNGDEYVMNVDDAEINPEHYKNGAYETIDEMMIVFGPEATALYCRMCAWKYRARAPYKNEFASDMAKANWYLRKADQITGVLQAFQQQQQPMM